MVKVCWMTIPWTSEWVLGRKLDMVFERYDIKVQPMVFPRSNKFCNVQIHVHGDIYECLIVYQVLNDWYSTIKYTKYLAPRKL